MPETRELTREHSHPPQLPRLTWTDRLAVHVGLALIQWAERPPQSVWTGSSELIDTIEHRRQFTEAPHLIGPIG